MQESPFGFNHSKHWKIGENTPKQEDSSAVLIQGNSARRLSHYHSSKAGILLDPHFNKGTAFSHRERKLLGIQGLLPARVETIENQRERCMIQLKTFENPLNKYSFVNLLKQRDETLFYNVLLHNLEELLPIVYTPTVGEACIQFGSLWRTADGMFFSKDDIGEIRRILDNWPAEEVDIIVVTDGSRILGLGDLGANGMGIPIGKLSLYVAAGGFHPRKTLPICLDTGTNNEQLLNDPLYLGQRHKRMDNESYYAFMEEFLMAVKNKWPNALLQFEDFSNDHCFDLLAMYRDRIFSFNDDIQGTGAVIASGFINACKVTGIPMNEQKLVFFGAGSAGIGVANSIVAIMEEHGIPNLEARRKFWFVDSKGLVTNNRGDILEHHKVPYARDDVDKDRQLSALMDVIKAVKPTGLIGLSGIPKAFSKEILNEMAKNCNKPMIFSLSNPTSKAECTAQEAYEWTEGNCVFASGSPFPPVHLNGKTFIAGQGNNMYIFPGLGFGSALCRAKKVSDGMINAAAKALSEFVTDGEIKVGIIYPKLTQIRDISAHIAKAVIERAFFEGLAQVERPADLLKAIKESMYQPEYLETVE